jgi:menaquinone-dependent protoporphyrinogen oxidase
MQVLIVHGSKLGATTGIAEMLAVAFADRGVTADVRPAESDPNPREYDAVIVGSALYAGHWRPDARHFVTHHKDELRRMPVWFFSSGPLDRSAEEKEIAPVHEVAQLAREVGARGHETFGGKLDPQEARGIVAKLMARKLSGDWRDQQHIVTWADTIADQLESRRHHPSMLGPIDRPADRTSAS